MPGATMSGPPYHRRTWSVSRARARAGTCLAMTTRNWCASFTALGHRCPTRITLHTRTRRSLIASGMFCSAR
eukprot:11211294-Lingulodinium_polyedra.AAC.1